MLIIKEIEFEAQRVHWRIMEACNHRILSIEALSKLIDSGDCMQNGVLVKALEELKIERLIDCNTEKTTKT